LTMTGKLEPQRNLSWLAILLIACLSGCEDRSEPPPYYEILVLEGDAYERGYQHGEHFSSKIRSLYTVLLETSLLPYLNREQGDVMLFLEEYQKPEYQDGKFSYEMLLQSGKNLEEIMEETHPEYVEEMKGIADGSGIPYDQILVLNTFVDTMLAFRSVTLFIRQLQAPRILQVDFLGSLASDGIDNNGDGLTDEEDDGTVKEHLYRDVWSSEYAPRPYAAMVEVPTDARIRLILFDPPGLTGFKDPDGEQKEGEEQGMDPESIRLQLGSVVYTAEDDCIQTTTWGEGEDENGMEVIFTPPGGLPPAEEISLIVQAGNLSRIVTPPPVHARFMRDERIVFSTRGLGKRHYEIPNLGEWDGRNMPTALGFAVRESATPDRHIRMAHHFALLDSNTSHKHTVMLVHRPDDGKAHVTLGWAGLVWGFSGMNEDGLTYMVNYSDTLDNPFAGQVRLQVWMAKLLCTGIPVGIKGRRMLDRYSTVDQAEDMLRGEESTFGWNFLLGDARRNMAVVELDNNILDEDDGGALSYDPDASNPENLDANGRRFASVGPDDLRIASHFAKNVPDIDATILIFDVQPQRYWSSFYYRSLRTFFSLAERIESRYGHMDTDEIIGILRTPALVDLRDSMNAVVYEPEDLRLRFSMGQVPATDGEFIDFDLGAALTEGGSP
jgi:hypothetical protein